MVSNWCQETTKPGQVLSPAGLNVTIPLPGCPDTWAVARVLTAPLAVLLWPHVTTRMVKGQAGPVVRPFSQPSAGSCRGITRGEGPEGASGAEEGTSRRQQEEVAEGGPGGPPVLTELVPQHSQPRLVLPSLLLRLLCLLEGAIGELGTDQVCALSQGGTCCMRGLAGSPLFHICGLSPAAAVGNIPDPVHEVQWNLPVCFGRISKTIAIHVIAFFSAVGAEAPNDDHGF